MLMLPAGVLSLLAATTLSIDHRATGCVAAERHPVIQARITPAQNIGRARVVFRAGQTAHWYAVEMQAEGTTFRGTLPQPLKATRGIEYYVEAIDTGLAESRTAQHTAQVAESCPTEMDQMSVTTAAITVSRLLGSAPGLPVGFSSAGLTAGTAAGTTAAAAATAGGGGGLSTPAILGIVGAAGAIAGGAAVALGSSGDSSTWTGTGTLAAPDPRECSVQNDVTLNLTEEGSALSGRLALRARSSTGSSPGCPPAGNTQEFPVTGTTNGAEFQLTLQTSAPHTFAATRSGNTIAGTWSFALGQQVLSGTWSVTRR